MSNLIWKTGSPKGIHEEDRLGDYYVAEFHREDGSNFYEAGGTCDICGMPDRWTFLTDLIAQADKAERLEEENEAMREEFEVWHGNHKCVLEDNERLQKAVDLALDTLKKAETTRELTVKGHYVHAISLDELHSALKEIKQLTQGNK